MADAGEDACVRDALAKQREALEAAFFRRENERLLAEMRARRRDDRARDDAARASGISDETVLDLVLDLGMASETLAALALVPLVEVAWADGRIEAPERSTVLSAAAAQGIEKGTPGFDLLSAWLRQRPDPGLFDAWSGYVRGLCARLPADQCERLRRDLLRRARLVAQAAGGFLRLGSNISREEEAVLHRLEAAFKDGP